MSIRWTSIKMNLPWNFHCLTTMWMCPRSYITFYFQNLKFLELLCFLGAFTINSREINGTLPKERGCSIIYCLPQKGLTDKFGCSFWMCWRSKGSTALRGQTFSCERPVEYRLSFVKKRNWSFLISFFLFNASVLRAKTFFYLESDCWRNALDACACDVWVCDVWTVWASDAWDLL